MLTKNSLERNVRLNDLSILMHYTIENNEIIFNKPLFTSLEEVDEFINWLLSNGVKNVEILSPEGDILTKEQCIGRDHFILSREAIDLCVRCFDLIYPNIIKLLTNGVQDQVTIILDKRKKVA